MEMVLEESGDFAWSLLWSRAFLAALYAAGCALRCVELACQHALRCTYCKRCSYAA